MKKVFRGILTACTLTSILLTAGLSEVEPEGDKEQISDIMEQLHEKQGSKYKVN